MRYEITELRNDVQNSNNEFADDKVYGIAKDYNTWLEAVITMILITMDC